MPDERSNHMTKFTITRLWIAGVIAFAVGLAVAGAGLGLMLAYGGHFTPALSGNGYDFAPTLNGFFWTTITVMILGGLVAAVGGVAQLGAWIGALVNTYQIPEKTWFIVLLAGGLLGMSFGPLGFAAMLAYVIAGPDGVTGESVQSVTAHVGAPLAPATQ
jgi:hypothetical protein